LVALGARRTEKINFRNRRAREAAGVSNGARFEPGAVAIDPLARRRDRLSASRRRRSEYRKKEKGAKKKWPAGAGGIGRAAHGKNKFSKSESERGRGRVTRLVSGVTIPARNG